MIDDQRVRDRIAKIVAACPTISNDEALRLAAGELGLAPERTPSAQALGIE